MSGMFRDLIEALKAQDLKPGETIGLKKLCEFSGLPPSRFGWVLDSRSCSWMLAEELADAGFCVRSYSRGRFKCHEFSLIEEG